MMHETASRTTTAAGLFVPKPLKNLLLHLTQAGLQIIIVLSVKVCKSRCSMLLLTTAKLIDWVKLTR